MSTNVARNDVAGTGVAELEHTPLEARTCVECVDVKKLLAPTKGSKILTPLAIALVSATLLYWCFSQRELVQSLVGDISLPGGLLLALAIYGIVFLIAGISLYVREHLGTDTEFFITVDADDRLHIHRENPQLEGYRTDDEHLMFGRDKENRPFKSYWHSPVAQIYSVPGLKKSSFTRYSAVGVWWGITVPRTEVIRFSDGEFSVECSLRDTAALTKYLQLVADTQNIPQVIAQRKQFEKTAVTLLLFTRQALAEAKDTIGKSKHGQCLQEFFDTLWGCRWEDKPDLSIPPDAALQATLQDFWNQALQHCHIDVRVMWSGATYRCEPGTVETIWHSLPCRSYSKEGYILKVDRQLADWTTQVQGGQTVEFINAFS